MFTGVEVGIGDSVVIRAVLGSLDAQEIDRTFFLVHEAGDWTQRALKAPVVSFCLGNRGAVYALTPVRGE